MSTAAAAETQTPRLQDLSPGLVEELRDYLQRHRSEVSNMIRGAGVESGLVASERYARIYDGLLCTLFHAVQAARTARSGWHESLALVGVGSYGRGVLAFHSDLDVRLVCDGDNLGVVEPVVESLLYPLWDIGLNVGHQVVTADEMVELARSDLPTATSILDWRVIAGPERSSKGLLERLSEGVFGIGSIGTFLQKLQERVDERYERYGGSVFHLEPDVKNGPGGLRDLDVAHWAARARWRIKSFKDLVRFGVLLPREHEQIHAASEHLTRVRNLLHLHSGRRSDRLSFERQEQLAEDLGYGRGGQAVERFMSEYYRMARSIARSRDMLMYRALPPPTRKPHVLPIGKGLKVINGELSFAAPNAVDHDPAVALRIYDEAVTRDLPVYAFARDAISRAATRPDFCEQLRASDEAGRLFIRLARTVKKARLKAGTVMRELHDVGLMLAMVPEFAPVVGRVHHDIYHVYTVDAHSVACLDKLGALVRGELADEYPLASRLAAELARPEVLSLSCLLHDIGKDIGGRNHSERGADMADTVLRRLGLEDALIPEVQQHIAKHLRMYHVATRRDLDDPQTIEAFCDELGGIEGLPELYLLTICDVSTTNPTALTAWKVRMLDDLYFASERHLQDGREVRSSAAAESIRHRVRELSTRTPVAPDGALPATPEFADVFLAAMPERYLYSNEPAEIVAHVSVAQAALVQPYELRLLDSDEQHASIALAAEDGQGMLARVTAALAANRLPVTGAQLYSWTDEGGQRRILDLFWVRAAQGVNSVLGALTRVRKDMGRMLNDELTPAGLVKGRLSRSGSLGIRHEPAVRPRVSIDNRAASQHTVIEVTTRDSQGLLFRLASAITELGLSVGLAKINTEGNAVADVFYVCERDGEKVTERDRLATLEAAILATISQDE